MSSAYNETNVYNLAVIKEAKRWNKSQFIDNQQLSVIRETYKVPFYHPNFTIRIILFVATILALSGVTGFFFLIFADAGETVMSIAGLFYGVASFVVLEKAFIGNNHYKSGVTEALLYHAAGCIILGLAGLTDFNPHVIMWSCLFVISFAAIRYIDMLCTLAAVVSLAAVLFFEFYNMGGIFQQIIPFIFILGFTPIYFLSKRLSKRRDLKLWRTNFLIVEHASLLLIYLGGNYLVVRELSVAMLDLQLEPGQDIPFAIIFYALTVIIPVTYLYFGIKKKDMVLIRVSLIVLALSVFTFKYYYNFGHPEITITIAGVILLLISIALLNYLKINRDGFTRENLLTEKWAGMNVEAFVVSQTMGGNQGAAPKVHGGGGSFGGGGASGDY
ncbi:MAG: hypothetical protein HOP08_10050 [Cyclobacteriaceae bacterium]|nr:hypothetical protein [Cyclobacteriaceae bacterium]